MSTVAIIAIVVVAVIVIALVVAAANRKKREREFGNTQVEAQRDDAQHHRAQAEDKRTEAAVAEGIPLVAVLPFPDADKPWPEPSRRRFSQLRDAAVTEVLLERKLPETTAKVAGSLRRRDAWLAKNLDEAIVVWDGQEPFVGRLLATLRDRLGDDVWEEPVPAPGR